MNLETQNLGEVTDTRTEWAELQHRFGAADTYYCVSTDTRKVRDLVAFDQQALSRGRLAGGLAADDIVSVDLVCHTVTEYASGHKLIGPWEVSE